MMPRSLRGERSEFESAIESALQVNRPYASPARVAPGAGVLLPTPSSPRPPPPPPEAALLAGRGNPLLSPGGAPAPSSRWHTAGAAATLATLAPAPARPSTPPPPPPPPQALEDAGMSAMAARSDSWGKLRAAARLLSPPSAAAASPAASPPASPRTAPGDVLGAAASVRDADADADASKEREAAARERERAADMAEQAREEFCRVPDHPLAQRLLDLSCDLFQGADGAGVGGLGPADLDVALASVWGAAELMRQGVGSSLGRAVRASLAAALAAQARVATAPGKKPPLLTAEGFVAHILRSGVPSPHTLEALAKGLTESADVLNARPTASVDWLAGVLPALLSFLAAFVAAVTMLYAVAESLFKTPAEWDSASPLWPHIRDLPCRDKRRSVDLVKASDRALGFEAAYLYPGLVFPLQVVAVVAFLLARRAHATPDLDGTKRQAASRAYQLCASPARRKKADAPIDALWMAAAAMAGRPPSLTNSRYANLADPYHAVVLGAATSVARSVTPCDPRSNGLCAWRDVAHLSEAAVAAAPTVRTTADIPSFFGYRVYLCVPDATACIDSDDPTTTPTNFREHYASFASQTEQAAATFHTAAEIFSQSDLGIIAEGRISAAGRLSRELYEAAARSSSELHNNASSPPAHPTTTTTNIPPPVWTLLPFTTCNRVNDDNAGGILRQELERCYATSSGGLSREYQPDVKLDAILSVRHVPLKEPTAFPFFGPEPQTSLVAVSYLLDTMPAPILPCPSDVASPCALHNAAALAGRLKTLMYRCVMNQRIDAVDTCLMSVFQEATYGTSLHIGKGSAEPFYAYIIDGTSSRFLAHGGNPQLVGVAMNQLGPTVLAAYTAVTTDPEIDDAAEYGRVVSYDWYSASCQSGAGAGAIDVCTPFLKAAYVFRSDFDNGTTLYGGVGYNHVRMPFPPIDDWAGSHGTGPRDDRECDAGFALPCAFVIVRGLMSYVQSALSIFSLGQVVDEINNATSTEFKKDSFYVFVFDADDGRWLAHGANPALAVGEARTSIDDVADSLGFPPAVLNGTALRASMTTAAQRGGGWVKYNWTHPVYGVAPKLSYVNLAIDPSTGTTAVYGVGFTDIPYIARAEGANATLCPRPRRNRPCSRNRAISAVGVAIADLVTAAIDGSATFDRALAKMNVKRLASGGSPPPPLAASSPAQSSDAPGASPPPPLAASSPAQSSDAPGASPPPPLATSSPAQSSDAPGASPPPPLAASSPAQSSDVRSSIVPISILHEGGKLFASSQPLRNDSALTWGQAYAKLPFGELIEKERRSIDPQRLFARMLEVSNAGGGWVDETSFRRAPVPGDDTSPHIWYVTSPICLTLLYEDGTSCAFGVAELDDSGCDEGYELLADGTCHMCEPGTYHDVRGTGTCMPCPRGSFTGAGGKVECTPCRELPDAQFRYQDAEGMTSCSRCPQSTIRKLTEPAVDVRECLCEPDSYQPELQPSGAPCIKCPDGARCLGSQNGTNAQPYPLPGFWGVPTHPHEMLECEFGAAQCKGGPGFECGEGYEGNFCEGCSPGTYRTVGECVKCNGPIQPVYTALVITAIFSLWFGINALPHEALYVLLEFMQTSDQIGNFGLDWGSELIPWQRLSAFVNFDVDIVAVWMCHVHWTYVGRVVLLFALPWAKVAILVIIYTVKRTTFWLVRTKRLAHFPPFLEADQKYVDEGPERIISDILSFHHIMYLALCERTFSTFALQSSPDGSRFMTDSAAVIVGQPLHNAMLGLSSYALIFYVIGIPTFQAYVLFEGRRKNLLATPSHQIKYGFLYRRYEADFYWWELVIQLRRVCLCAVNYFAWDDPIIQASVGLILCGVFLALQFFSRPFRHIFIDRLDSAACITNMIYCVVGLVDTYGTDENQKFAYRMMMNGIFIVISCYAFCLLGIEHFNMSATQRASKHAAKRFRRLLSEDCKPGTDETESEMHRRMCRILNVSRLAFRLLQEEDNGVLCPYDVAKNFGKLAHENPCEKDGFTMEQAEGIVAMMSRYTDVDGNHHVLEDDFLLHIASELLSRNVPEIGRGSGVRAEMRARGLTSIGVPDLFLTDALDKFATRLGFAGTELKLGDAGSRDAALTVVRSLPRNFSRLTSRRQRDDDPDDKARREAAMKYHIDPSRLSAASTIELMSGTVLMELLHTFDPHGLVGVFCSGLEGPEAVEVMRLERVLREILSDAGPVSDFRHTPYAITMRKLTKACPSMIDYLSDTNACPQEDVAAIGRLMRFLSQSHEAHGSHTSPAVTMLQAMDHAAIMDWLITASTRDRESFRWLMERVLTKRVVTDSSQGVFGQRITSIMHSLVDILGGRREDETLLHLKKLAKVHSATLDNAYDRSPDGSPSRLASRSEIAVEPFAVGHSSGSREPSPETARVVPPHSAEGKESTIIEPFGASGVPTSRVHPLPGLKPPGGSPDAV